MTQSSKYKLKDILLWLLFSKKPINIEYAQVPIKENSVLISWSALFLHTTYFVFKYLPYLSIFFIINFFTGGLVNLLTNLDDITPLSESLPGLFALFTAVSIFYIKYLLSKKTGSRIARFRFLTIVIILFFINSSFESELGYIELTTSFSILIAITCALPYYISKKIKEKLNETGLHLLFKQWRTKLISLKDLPNTIKTATQLIDIPNTQAIKTVQLGKKQLLLSAGVGSIILISWLYIGTPSGISDTDYENYQQLAGPKILYSCTQMVAVDFRNLAENLSCMREGNTDEECRLKTTVDYKAGIGIAATYNKLLGEAKDECSGEQATFKIIESEK
ncbi:MAG: hypothetical protein RIQ94_1723 [Pseudomonadota bacterium]|jgi:hypothetical protein